MNIFASTENDDDEPTHITREVPSAYDILPKVLLRHALTPDQRDAIADDRSLCLVIQVPSREWVSPVLRSITALGNWDYRVVKVSQGRSRTSGDEGESRAIVETLAQGGRVVGVAADLDHLPEVLRAAADAIVRLDQPSAEILLEVVQAVAGPCSADIADIPTRLTFHQIVACLRSGTSARECIERLTRIDKDRRTADMMVSDVPELGQLHGYGEAMTWALQLADDLEAWRRGTLKMSDLQSSVILASAPGLGKTTFIRSVARTTGLPLVATSVSQWFSSSSGHLDGVIKQIDEVFAKARSLAPAIIFLDECDALPSRIGLDARNRDYWLPVIAHMLTTLDGAISGQTKDLIIVAATNFPESLDPAICRPGRLSRIIRIGLPDETALAGILRQHLGQDLPMADLSEAARLAHGCTGADVTAYVKTARATARTAQRPMELLDLLDAIAPRDHRDPDHLYRIALHEAGHAVIAYALKLGRVRSVSIVSRGVAGGFCHVEGDGYAPTRAILEDHVVQMLGGRASEEAVLGEAGSGAGGHESSDLASATREVALLRLSLGLGDELLYRGSREDVGRVMALDPRVSTAVEADLRRLYVRALGIVRDHQRLIEAIADELLSRRHIGGDRFLEIVEAAAKTGVRAHG